MGRALLQRGLQGAQPRRGARGMHFHGPVLQIRRPPRKAERPGLAHHEIAKSHALHAPLDAPGAQRPVLHTGHSTSPVRREPRPAFRDTMTTEDLPCGLELFSLLCWRSSFCWPPAAERGIPALAGPPAPFPLRPPPRLQPARRGTTADQAMIDQLEFFKMSGAGNDFILGDNRHGSWSALPLDHLARSLCRQHLGVGADGLILVETSKKAHIRLRIFNSDGSESPMCGNGARCAARYAFLKVIAGRVMTMEVGPEVIGAEVLGDGRVRVEVPAGGRAPERISLRVQGRTIPAYLTDTGVPHLVVFVKDVEAVPVQALGAALRRAPETGPGGANVDFVAPSPAPPFRMRTFERGVESETLACGTGATAVAWTLRSLGLAGTDVVLLPRSGRELVVSMEQGSGAAPKFQLTGDARQVYRGILSQEALQEVIP